MNLHTRDVPEECWDDALHVARMFLKQYPDRVGFSNFVVYSNPSRVFIVYRTKADNVIVRWQPKE